MWTTQNPTHCPNCMSRNIVLGDKVYKKDVFGEDTDIVILGSWFCNDCGNLIGRKMNQYENDLDKESL
ncbi:hypothetical protein GCM10008922_25260 [Faecalicatena contorta]|uniref:Uncharacterized protein n=1 Tax=Hungatella hathewayi TaxID=154046 RepID=A0A3E2WG44_9FIRM|nr:hypothetical protein [Hungatella hathewayi]MEE0200790.1 hypothetical protein [Muricomes sp.]RGC24874.1 hypothetical protein DWX41_20915 [Hungatella hathewayi]